MPSRSNSGSWDPFFDFDNMPLSEGPLIDDGLSVPTAAQTDIYYQRQLQQHEHPLQETLQEDISDASPALKEDSTEEQPPFEVNFFAHEWPAIDREAHKLIYSRDYRREATLKWRNKRLLQEKRRQSQKRQCELSSKRSPKVNETGETIPSLKSVRALERKRSNGRFVAKITNDTFSNPTQSAPFIATTSNDSNLRHRSNMIDASKMTQGFLPSDNNQGILSSTSSMEDVDYDTILSLFSDDSNAIVAPV